MKNSVKSSSRFLILGVLYLFYLIPLISQGNSNNVFINASASINPSSVTTCQGQSTFRFDVLNVDVVTLTGVEVTYTLPSGVNYVSAFTNSQGFTVTEIDVSDPSHPVLGISDLAPGDNPRIEIVVDSDCGLVGAITLNNGIRIDVGNNSVFDTTMSPDYVPENPSIITTTDIPTIEAQFGESYTRLYTLEQSGNGFLTELFFERTFGDAYTLDALYLITTSGEQAIPFTVIPGSGTTDTVRVMISNADLIAAGITDGTFDQGDQIQIREEITVVDCDGNNGGQALGYWGCGAEICEKINPISVGIVFGAFAPDLAVFDYSAEDRIGVLPAGDQFPLSYNCDDPFTKVIGIVNRGNETATDILIDLYEIDPQSNVLDTAFGFFYQIGVNGTQQAVDGYDLTESWAGNDVAPRLWSIANGGTPGTNLPVPRRADISLASLSLSPADTLYLIFSTISYANDWDEHGDYLPFCSTGAAGYIRGRTRIQGFDYSDPCGSLTIQEGSQGDDNYNYQRLVTGNGESPTIIFDGTTGTTSWLSSSAVNDGWRSIENGLGALDNTAYFDFRFTLPEGVDYAGDPNDPNDSAFRFTSANGLVDYVPSQVIYTDNNGGPDELIFRYFLDANPMPANFSWTTNTSFELSYVGDCGEIVQPPCPEPQNNPNVRILKETYFVASTSCGRKYFMDCPKETDPIQVFCSACPCPLGVQYVDAGIERTNYGNPDNNQDGIADTLPDGSVQPQSALNLAELQLNRFIEGDTLGAYYLGFVNTTLGATPPGDSVDVMPYMFGQTVVPDANTFIGLTATAAVFDASTGIWHMSTVPLPTFQEGNSWLVDLSAETLINSAGMMPALPPDFVYEDTDSVSYNMDIRSERNIGNVELTTDFTMLIWGSDVEYPSNDPENRRFACIPPGVNDRRLTQYGWREDKLGQGTVQINGCEQRILFNFANNILWTRGFIDPFPYEHRALFFEHEIRFNLPEGYTITTDSVEIYYYRNNPLGSNILTVFDAPYELIAGGDSVRVYDIQKIVDELGIQSSGSFQVNVRPSFQASCGVADGSRVTIQTRPYPGYNPDQFAGLQDSIFISMREPNANYNIDYAAPQLNAIADAPITNGYERVASWTLNFQNLAPAGVDAYNTWFYFDNNLSDGQISVDSVFDISLGMMLYPNDNGFFELGDLPGVTSKQYTVFATYDNCDLECIEWYSGYNCPGYFTSIDDPLIPTETCSMLDTLCIQPNEALWQASVFSGLEEADLCDMDELIFDFTNVQTGHSYNTMVQILSPLNTIVSPTYVEYPIGGTSYPVPASAVTFIAPNEYYVDLEAVVPGLSDSGIPGPLTSGQNNFRLAYSVTLECGYLSGSTFFTNVFGENSCGSSTNTAGAPPQTVGVTGVPEPYFINPRLSTNDSISVCNNSFVLRVNALKLGNNPIGTNDSLRITLPLGASYVPNSINFLNNPLPQTEPDVDSVGNLLLYQWNLPTPVAELDSIDFTIELMFNDSIACGTMPITVQTFVDATSFCSDIGENCGVKSQTGARTIQAQINRPVVNLDNFTACSDAADVYVVAGSVTVTEEDLSAAESLQFEVYCTGDLVNPIGTVNIPGPITAGTTIAVQDSFPRTCAEGDQLYFTTAQENCICAPVDTFINIIPEVLVDAGNDLTFCQTRPITLASLNASITGGTTTGVWSSTGDGTFTTTSTYPSAEVYVPGPMDLRRGQVTLTLTSDPTEGACQIVSDNVIITILTVDCGTFPWDGN